MEWPTFSEAEAQHYLSAEVLAGVGLIVFDGLAQGEFPGPMAFFPFLTVFFLLSLFAMFGPLTTATVYFGTIILVMLFLAPSPVKDKLAGQLLFASMGQAAGSVADSGASSAQGYGGGDNAG